MLNIQLQKLWSIERHTKQAVTCVVYKTVHTFPRQYMQEVNNMTCTVQDQSATLHRPDCSQERFILTLILTFSDTCLPLSVGTTDTEGSSIVEGTER